MDVFEQLKKAVGQARRENELPDHLAEAILEIAEDPSNYSKCTGLVNRLVERLPDYDTYAQTGYLGMGVNDADIGMLLKAIKEEGKSGSN
ncbi:MAG TPA: hypothetical protein VJ882_00530 [Desulfuromonadales bacterium]|nr:hypothetical protein [Desulfuromonadales bacterium]